jgi:cation transport ATPase
VQHALTLTEQGKTPVYIGVDGKMSALFGIADRPRATAGKAVAMQVGIDAVIMRMPSSKLSASCELKAIK